MTESVLSGVIFLPVFECKSEVSGSHSLSSADGEVTTEQQSSLFAVNTKKNKIKILPFFFPVCLHLHNNHSVGKHRYLTYL